MEKLRFAKIKRSRTFLLLVLSAVSLMSAVGIYLIFFTQPTLNEHVEYKLDFGHTELRWGSFNFDVGLPSMQRIRVEYLLPENFSPESTPLVFYAPFGNSKNSLSRPQVYTFATEKKMMVFTMAFDYEIERNLPANQRRTDVRSGWYEKIFEAQRLLERKFAMPHRKLLLFGDSSGALMTQQMSRFFSDNVEAAGWIGANYITEYQSANHPPLLAICTWGDGGVMANQRMVEQDRTLGGYSLFMTGPPSWPEKGYNCFHHGGHDLDYALIREFFSGIADLRQKNNNISIPFDKWQFEITANGSSMKAPSEAFKKLWEQFPHEAVGKLGKNIANSDDGLFILRPDQPKDIVFYLQPPSWEKELWLVDNLFFFFENGSIGVSYPIVEKIDGYLPQILSGLSLMQKNTLLAQLPVTIVCAGELAESFAKVLASLPDDDMIRIKRVIYLNPPGELPTETLLSFNGAEIWSNNEKYREKTGAVRIFYREEQGDSFGHTYFTVLEQILYGAKK